MSLGASFACLVLRPSVVKLTARSCVSWLRFLHCAEDVVEVGACLVHCPFGVVFWAGAGALVLEVESGEKSLMYSSAAEDVDLGEAGACSFHHHCHRRALSLECTLRPENPQLGFQTPRFSPPALDVPTSDEPFRWLPSQPRNRLVSQKRKYDSRDLSSSASS